MIDYCDSINHNKGKYLGLKIKLALKIISGIVILIIVSWALTWFNKSWYISKVIHNVPASPHFAVRQYDYIDKGSDFNDYIAETKKYLLANTNPIEGFEQNVDDIVELNLPFYYSAADKCGNTELANILMIHGLGRSPHHMRDIGKFLSDECVSVRAIVMPGHGADPGLLSKITDEQFMQGIYARAEEFIKNTKGKRYVLGFSYGGMMASTIAQRHSDDLTGLVLFSPSFSGSENPRGSRSNNEWWENLTYVPLGEHGLLYPAYHRTLTVQSLLNLFAQRAAFNNGVDISLPTLLYQSQADRSTRYDDVIPVAKKKFENLQTLFYATNQDALTVELGDNVTILDPRDDKKKVVSMSHLAAFVRWNSPHYSHEGVNGCRNPVNFDCEHMPDDVVFGGLRDVPENVHLSRLVSNPHFERDMKYLIEFISQN